MGKIEDLEKLQHLKEIGALTDEEFEKEKRIILNDDIQNTKSQGNSKNTPKKKNWTILSIIIRNNSSYLWVCIIIRTV